jgi:hypothetical protein
MAIKKGNKLGSTKTKTVKKKKPLVAAVESIVKSIKRRTSDANVDVSLDNIIFIIDDSGRESSFNSLTRPRRWVCRFKNGRLKCGWE